VAGNPGVNEELVLINLVTTESASQMPKVSRRWLGHAP
jgi:hypothetical protein